MFLTMFAVPNKTKCVHAHYKSYKIVNLLKGLCVANPNDLLCFVTHFHHCHNFCRHFPAVTNDPAQLFIPGVPVHNRECIMVLPREQLP